MDIELYRQKVTDNLMPLLLMADPDVGAIKKYINGSTIFIAKESDILVGIVIITLTDSQYEIKNIAVLESHQEKGIAKKLISKTKNFVRDNGAKAVIIGTGNSSLNQLALYQKCGFRIHSVRKNYFTKYPKPIFENGIRCLDMVILKAEL